jgi:formamidopyrimidine-DNA glycosylase
MPELPEVEVTRRSLLGRIEGHRIRSLSLGKPLRWPLGADPATLAGRVLGEPQRRGKYLWLPLTVPPPAPGEAPAPGGGLLIHLGMSGSLRWWDATAEPVPARGPHDHLELLTAQGGVLRLDDPRRFGAVVWGASLEAPPVATLLARLGLEPFDPFFGGITLRSAWKGRRQAVKQALLAGDVVVGVGNIYCSEALFAAGIDPRTPAGKVGPLRCERLATAVREVLGRALDAGGSTLRDFSDAHGLGGQFQAQARVYGREGQPCTACGTPVRRIVQGQRATYFCPVCQKR